ncbi:helix-turn-helix domain-containing protein [Streptomyces nigra]|uniref:helix-turn-helix domain-containing protein n=1 Tax=Streptomyces nigra TaxID=1827580 RepID=UPI00367A4C0F
MPGGRLTLQERQRIATGLADGLAYAEIARSLERPTSTVTREVMRNGGPTEYRADLAHRAAERRAHRRRTASAPDPASGPLPYGRDEDAVAEYEERFTTVMMGSGLAKTMSRVMVCLLTSDTGSMTAADLAKRLGISPATVSKSIAFLESQSLVRRQRDERRRERYVIDEDLWYQSMIASVRSLEEQVELAREGVDVLGPGTPAAVRLENVSHFLQYVAENLARAAEQAREVLHAKPSSETAGD